MEQKSISDELENLRSALGDVIRVCNFPNEASNCLLRMIAAGELDVAFETLEDNISEHEELSGSVELRERLTAIRRRLDLLPSTHR
jgi:hypothetical protein